MAATSERIVAARAWTLAAAWDTCALSTSNLVTGPPSSWASSGAGIGEDGLAR